MYSVYSDGVCIYSDLYVGDSKNAISPKLKLVDNSAGSLEITLPLGNAGYKIIQPSEMFSDSKTYNVGDMVIYNGKIYKCIESISVAGSWDSSKWEEIDVYNVNMLSSDIVVKRDNDIIWSGRVISEKQDFQNNRILTCEGELAFFNDTTQPPIQYGTEDDPESVEHCLEMLIIEHNSKICVIDGKKHIDIGRNDFANKYYDEPVIFNNETTIELLKKYFIDMFGGHFRIRRVKSTSDPRGYKLYLDYLKDYVNTDVQEIRFGKNLLDFTKNYDVSDFVTAIVPRGADLGESDIEGIDDYVNVSEINFPWNNPDPDYHKYVSPEGETYVADKDAVDAYGYIESVVDFEDVEEVNELFDKAIEYLQSIQFKNLVLELSAVDLGYLIQNANPINLLDGVKCVSLPHGLNRVLMVTELDIQLDNPDGAKYTLGTEEKSTLTSSINKVNENVIEKIKNLPSENSVLTKAKEEATLILNQKTQGFVTIVKEPNDGEYTEYIAVSTTKYNPSYSSGWSPGTHLWTWSANGLGYGTVQNNGQIEYTIAMNSNGQIVADFIATGTMSADRVRTGMLTSSEDMADYPDYDPSSDYYPGDKVKYNNHNWMALHMVDGIDSNPHAPSEEVVWEETSAEYNIQIWDWHTRYVVGKKVWCSSHDVTNYSTSENYEIDDMVYYNGGIYVCVSPTSGTWNSSKWEDVTFDSDYVSFYEAIKANSYHKPLWGPLWEKLPDHNVVFDLNNGSLTISSGKIRLGANSSGGYNFSVNDDGELNAELGKIGGFTITAYSIYNDSIRLDSDGISFTVVKNGFYNDVGYLGRQYWTKNPTKYGLVNNLNVSDDYCYIGWFRKEGSTASSSTMKLMYTSKDLLTDDPSGTDYFLADRIHLGTYMQLDHYGFAGKFKNSHVTRSYKSFSYVYDDSEALNEGMPKPITFTWTHGSHEYTLQCYIVNGVLMSLDV